MYWWSSLLVQLVGAIFVILSADKLFFRNRNDRLDGRRAPEQIGDTRFVWFVLLIGLFLVFMPYILQPMLMNMH